MLKTMKFLPSVGPRLARFVPFDNKAGWKVIKVGDVEAVEIKDGNPVYVQSDGTEAVIERDTIARLNTEAKTHREAKETAETKLKAFEGLDATKAREALETVGKLDAKKLIDAGEVDRVKDQMRNEFKGQIDTLTKERDDERQATNNLRIETAFAGSKFIGEKLVIPNDIVRATFGQNFKVENGKIVAYGSDGNRLLSKTRIGEAADFDEALSMIVDGYASKDAILKGGNQGGSGNNGGGGGGGNNGKRRYSRAEFDAMNEGKRIAVSKEIREGKAEVYD